MLDNSFRKSIAFLVGAFMAAAVLLSSAGAVQATVITFDPLVGNNADVYTGHLEGGFSVAATLGDWREAHIFGNPTPAIFGNSDIAAVTVTSLSGLFTFSGVDLADAGGGGATFSIEGLLSSVSVLNLAGGPLPGSFLTIGSPDSAQLLDTLIITMNRSSATYNIDNIVVNSVPEPGTLALLALGLTGLGLMARRRRKVLA